MTDPNGTMLPWAERVAILSSHPEYASNDDVARMAAELMQVAQNRRSVKIISPQDSGLPPSLS